MTSKSVSSGGSTTPEERNVNVLPVSYSTYMSLTGGDGARAHVPPTAGAGPHT
jgi:hypothetical protein